MTNRKNNLVKSSKKLKLARTLVEQDDQSDEPVSEATTTEEIILRADKALVIPHMDDPDIRNHQDNYLDSPLFKLSVTVKKMGIEKATLNANEDYDITISMFTGDTVEDPTSINYKALNTGRPYFEFSWDGIAGRFFFERFGINGKLKDIMVPKNPDKEGSQVFISRDEVFGLDNNLDDPFFPSLEPYDFAKED